jgi:DNA-binding response OmpR family regulator
LHFVVVTPTPLRLEASLMNAEKLWLCDLIVVDANCDEYHALAVALCQREVRVRFFASGRDALRAIGAFPSALWIVNSRLPDMSGVGFLRLIRHRVRRCRVILVGDDYSTEDELAARSAGATAYVCKPASAAWLAGCRTRCRSPAIRAGPAPFF